jgi:16S rRNA C1402 N4-methylase RsmH
MPRGFSGGGGDLHYTKSGDLDMRYTSSREAVASEFSSYPSAEEVSYNDLGSGYSSYGEELHYKQDGTLDMRYTSSREASGYEAVASEFSSYPSAEEVSYNDLGSGYSSYGEELHYKKDGTLDMRYTSSREASGYEAVASEFSFIPVLKFRLMIWGLDIHRMAKNFIIRKMVHLTCGTRHPEKLQATPQIRLLHLLRLIHCITRKTVRWTCDIRHQKTAAATTEFNTSTGDDLHFKKDGSLDMRFNSSKMSGQPVASSQSGDLHYKKDGSLDMRYNSSKVASGLSNDLKKMQLIVI